MEHRTPRRRFFLVGATLMPVAVFAVAFFAQYRPPVDLPMPFDVPASPARNEPSPRLTEEPTGSPLDVRPARSGGVGRVSRYQPANPTTGTGWGVTVIAEPPRGWTFGAGRSVSGALLVADDPVLCQAEGGCPSVSPHPCEKFFPDGSPPEAVVREAAGATGGPPPRRVGAGVWRSGERLLQPFPGGGCLEYYVTDERLEPRTVVRVAEHITAHFGRRAVVPPSSPAALALAKRANRLLLEAPAAVLSAEGTECHDVGCQDVDERRHLLSRRAADAPSYADTVATRESIANAAPTFVRIGRRAFTARPPLAQDCAEEREIPNQPWLGYDPGLVLPTSRWLLSYAVPRRDGGQIVLEWRSYFDGGRARLDARTGRPIAYDRVERMPYEGDWIRTTATITYPDSIRRIDVRGRCPLAIR